MLQNESPTDLYMLVSGSVVSNLKHLQSINRLYNRKVCVSHDQFNLLQDLIRSVDGREQVCHNIHTLHIYLFMNLKAMHQ